MLEQSQTPRAPVVPEIGIGMIGYGFMGRAHTNAYKKLGYIIYPPPAIPRLEAIAGLDAGEVTAAAARFGYRSHYTDWRRMIDNDQVQVVDNGGPNHLHLEPTLLAAEAGKHLICEKPLARTAEEGWQMLEAVRKSSVKHMTAFNYRFVPAVRLMKDLIDEGKLGRIYHFRAVYLQDWLLPYFAVPYLWRMNKEASGSGAGGDLGAHVIDLAHFLLGDIEQVSALARVMVDEVPLPDGSGMGKVDVDNAFAAAIGFKNGAIGALECSRVAAGRKNYQVIEVNGERGSLRFNLERLNELEAYWIDEEPAVTRGFHQILVTETVHPWISNWWPPGHLIGWEHTFVHEMAHFLDCIVNDRNVAPYGATFEDGFRANVVTDAILKSSETRRVVDCDYLGVAVS